MLALFETDLRLKGQLVRFCSRAQFMSRGREFLVHIHTPQMSQDEDGNLGHSGIKYIDAVFADPR